MIEMLVVVIIISLIASIGTGAYRNQQAHVRYNDSVFKVLSMIKQARNYTVTSRSVYDDCEIDEADRVYVPEEGYGVYIERDNTPGESRVVLFANTVAGDEIETNQFDVSGSCAASDLIEEDFTIPGDANLVSLSVDKKDPHTGIGGSRTGDEVVIIFRPPLADATIAVNDDPPNIENLVILNDLYLQFRRPESPDSVPSTYIHFNHIAGFPEIEKE